MKKFLSLLVFIFSVNFISAQTKSDTMVVKKAEVFSYAETMPKFPGDSLMQFIAHNFVYPSIPKDHAFPTTYYVGFIVEQDGTLSDIIVNKPSGEPLADAEIIRVFSIMPKWSPATMGGKPVRVRMNRKIILDTFEK